MSAARAEIYVRGQKMIPDSGCHAELGLAKSNKDSGG